MLGLTLVLVSLLSAQPEPLEFESHEVREQFAYASELHAAGDFEGASEALKRAYELEPHPKLLYARAQVERLLERYEQAAELYAAYLASNPPEEGTVHARRHLLLTQALVARDEGRCAEAMVLFDVFVERYPQDPEVETASTGRRECIEALAHRPTRPVDERAEPPDAVPPPTPVPETAHAAPMPDLPPPKPWYRDTIGGTTAGLGIATLVSGALLVGLAYRDHRLAGEEGSHRWFEARHQRVGTFERAGAGLLGVSALSLTLAIIAYSRAAWRFRRDSSRPSTGLTLRF